ncbi:LmeA family phospholipid-binding protein [Corynebacterium fournieri]|uniref:LmeA family phospholipid-binding protein n=1 Tax=Corynebacterium fournieri TaxID=1852390 RepID=UPI001E4B0604|nr:DUF2993 domain-containing protein [Corynebacterium fournieri]WJY98238.1 hypothetical protein CFOUR_09265 [Corynebacterium fournieri]
MRKVAVGAVALVATLGLADTAYASHVERQLAPDGTEVQVTAAPFVFAGISGRVPRVTVRRTDADIPGPGVGTASVEMFNLKLDTPADALRGEIVGADARLVRRRIRLDGVGFGELLGITDLDIANPYDISPSGGVASEARLTGTVPGASEPATAMVTLRLSHGVFQMRPSQLIEVPQGDEDKVLDGFRIDFDTSDLPLGGPADLVQLTGGSLEFSRDRVNTVVEPADLEPLAGASTLERHD